MRLRGRTRWIASGVAIAFVVGILAALFVSRTEWGRGQVLAYTLRTLGGRLNGELTVERLEGDLITGARLYNIALRDTVGIPLALIDSAFIRYRLASLTGGDIVIHRLDAYGAQIELFRFPGDTLWNYQGILQDPTPGPAGEPGATLLETVTLHDGDIRIRVPLDVDRRLPEARRQQELAAIRADTLRFDLEESPTGTLRTTRVHVTDAELRELYIAPDERGGIYLEVVDAVTEVRLWKEPPLGIAAVSAALHMREGVVNYEAEMVRLEHSTGRSVGSIDLRGERMLYDVWLQSDSFVLADLRWLYPWLPDDPEAGAGSGQLWVEDRQDGLLVLARDVDLRMPGTHVTGRFGLISDAVADELRFVDVELEAEPLRVEAVENLLPEDLPVEGLVIGGATIRGES